ncbi:hypothetical protein KIPE111705_26845 [Kibdelosporangium persicum]|uniref:hypothetical protein n=1 Tax=Kibdelosporangium persicum TaxID=2698649 RepID=UPI001567B69E|nr:hypothetical protein [Kibdelosporangium persicum]
MDDKTRRDDSDQDLTASLAEDSDDPTEENTTPGRAQVMGDTGREANPTGTIGQNDYPVE